MLSTLHASENDPHYALEIAPDVVFSPRTDRPSPTLAPHALGTRGRSTGPHRIKRGRAVARCDVSCDGCRQPTRLARTIPSPRMGKARPDRLSVRHRQRFCRRRLATLRRSRHRCHRGLDAAVCAHLSGSGQSTRVPRPAYRPGCRRDRRIFAGRISRSSSRCRRGAVPGFRPDAVDPVDGARRCNDGATDRAVEGQHHRSQGWPGADVARDGKDSRSQGIRAEPGARGHHRRRCARRRQRQHENRVRHSPPRKPLRYRFRRYRLLHLPAPLQTAPAPQATTQPDGEPVVRPPMPLR